MSRRIVQIAAIPTGPDNIEALFALDNNGIAWCMARPYSGVRVTVFGKTPYDGTPILRYRKPGKPGAA